MHRLRDLNDYPRTQTRDGLWLPARALPYYGWIGVKQRIRDAWEVLRGRAEAVQFADQETEVGR